jgi:hypothetical protein
MTEAALLQLRPTMLLVPRSPLVHWSPIPWVNLSRDSIAPAGALRTTFVVFGPRFSSAVTVHPGGFGETPSCSSTMLTTSSVEEDRISAGVIRHERAAIRRIVLSLTFSWEAALASDEPPIINSLACNRTSESTNRLGDGSKFAISCLKCFSKVPTEHPVIRAAALTLTGAIGLRSKSMIGFLSQRMR